MSSGPKERPNIAGSPRRQAATEVSFPEEPDVLPTSSARGVSMSAQLLLDLLNEFILCTLWAFLSGLSCILPKFFGGNDLLWYFPVMVVLLVWQPPLLASSLACLCRVLDGNITVGLALVYTAVDIVAFALGGFNVAWIGVTYIDYSEFRTFEEVFAMLPTYEVPLLYGFLVEMCCAFSYQFVNLILAGRHLSRPIYAVVMSCWCCYLMSWGGGFNPVGVLGYSLASGKHVLRGVLFVRTLGPLIGGAFAHTLDSYVEKYITPADGVGERKKKAL